MKKCPYSYPTDWYHLDQWMKALNLIIHHVLLKMFRFFSLFILELRHFYLLWLLIQIKRMVEGSLFVLHRNHQNLHHFHYWNQQIFDHLITNVMEFLAQFFKLIAQSYQLELVWNYWGFQDWLLKIDCFYIFFLGFSL